MPTIYTEDPVAKAVEDHYLGTQGMYTGGAANSIGLNEHQRSSNAMGVSTYGGTTRAGHGGGSGYELLPFFQTILDAIPRWVYLLFAVAGGVAAFLLTRNADVNEGGTYVIAAIGAFTGGFIFQLTIVLVDLAIQIAWGLLKIAVVLGIIGGVIWGLSVLLR